MLKACREAKIRTSWQELNAGYEDAIRLFVDGVFANSEFIASLEAFVLPLVLPGRINGLSQALIKMTAPGVPDLYQGTELWDLSLVDPDNRRPVDFDNRSSLLDQCRHIGAAEALGDWDSGLPKLWMTARLLKLRQDRPLDFSASSDYQPLVARGAHLGNLLAFRRGDNLIVVVQRLRLSINGEWGDTSLTLPPGNWKSAFADRSLQDSATPAELFADFPVALLLRDDS